MAGGHLYLVFCVLAFALVLHATRPSAAKLPVFVKVRVKTTDTETRITASYRAPDDPDPQWFIDGFPVAHHHHASLLANTAVHAGHVELFTRVMNKAISVCLPFDVGKTCLYLRPQPPGTEREEDLSFSWPVVTPDPEVRYKRGQVARLFIHQLSTADHPYSHKATFIGRPHFGPHSPLLRAETRDMAGGREGDLINMEAATSGLPGWIVNVTTDRREYEGVILIDTLFMPTSDLVQSCTTTQPLSIYSKRRSAPFRPGYLSELPRDSVHLPWACRDGFSCLVTCPFVSNEDGIATLSRVLAPGVVERLPEVSKRVEVERLGGYLWEAKFVVPNFNRTVAPGWFRCDVDMPSDAIMFVVTV